MMKHQHVPDLSSDRVEQMVNYALTFRQEQAASVASSSQAESWGRFLTPAPAFAMFALVLAFVAVMTFHHPQGSPDGTASDLTDMMVYDLFDSLT